MKVLVRKCNSSCGNYLAIPKEKKGTCDYDEQILVSLWSLCKYDLATDKSIRAVVSREELLLRDTYQQPKELTVKEVLELMAQTSAQKAQ